MVERSSEVNGTFGNALLAALEIRPVILVGAIVLLVLLLRASSADASQATAAVIGGQPGSIPQLAQVGWTDAQGGGLCTGTLVAPNAILTAAHCANGPPGSYQVTLPSTAARPVTAVVIDPGYSPAADYDDDAPAGATVGFRCWKSNGFCWISNTKTQQQQQRHFSDGGVVDVEIGGDGRTLGQARRLLSSAYLALGRVHRAGWGVGIVRQSPAGGSWQRAGTRIALWVP